MKKIKLFFLTIIIALLTSACSEYDIIEGLLESIPEFSNSPYTTVNNNIPYFTEDEYTTESFEEYSSLDSFGRCGVAYANISLDTMPTEERGEIGQVKPSGWQTVKYDFVDGKYLYNRCHLIGFQLAGENANEKNLITGTRYMNVEGMLPFENMVADYVKETGNHVLYRVTPVYDGDNLVADGVQMEAFSVEDEGEGICFNVYVYNKQPGVTIDYATGDNWLAEDNLVAEKDTTQYYDDNYDDGNYSDDNYSDDNYSDSNYILNTNSKKFHYPSCSGAAKIKDSNKAEFSGDRSDLIDEGYSPCGICNP